MQRPPPQLIALPTTRGSRGPKGTATVPWPPPAGTEGPAGRRWSARCEVIRGVWDRRRLGCRSACGRGVFASGWLRRLCFWPPSAACGRRHRALVVGEARGGSGGWGGSAGRARKRRRRSYGAGLPAPGGRGRWGVLAAPGGEWSCGAPAAEKNGPIASRRCESGEVAPVSMRRSFMTTSTSIPSARIAASTALRLARFSLYVRGSCPSPICP